MKQGKGSAIFILYVISRVRHEHRACWIRRSSPSREPQKPRPKAGVFEVLIKVTGIRNMNTHSFATPEPSDIAWERIFPTAKLDKLRCRPPRRKLRIRWF
jgi:hypothetical protein